MVDNNNQSVFAFQRKFGDDLLIFVFNMTPNFYNTYDVPLLEDGVYEEIFNTDKDVYGGWGQYNGLPLTAEPYGPENKPYHISIKLASLGAAIFKRVNKKEVHTSLKNKKRVTTKKGK
jgi:1,4-alpha-glucan branching enzyme